MTVRPLARIHQSVSRSLADAVIDGRRVVLAVSGGVDSMVLLDAAATVLPRDSIVVATFDHATGPAATEAAALVAERCAELGIRCIRDVAQAALESEAELRAARWSFLRRVSREVGGPVCTAHTTDDQVETVLMRITRNAGARGLAGLFASGDTLRPMLSVTRREVVAYARRRNLTWIEDPSNASPKYFRNRIRRDLLPALRKVTASIDNDLLAVAARAARWRSELESYVDQTIVVRRVSRGVDVDARSLAGYPDSSLAILWPAIAAPAGVTLDRRGTQRLAAFTHSARVGARVQLSGGWEVIRSRDALQLRASRASKPTPSQLALSDTTSWYEWSFRPAHHADANDAWFAWLPSDRPLVIRAWQPGDAMGIRSSGRVRKVKELLSEAGVTGHQRRVWPVVVAEDGGEIVWIPGVRRSDAAADRTGRSGLSFFCEYVNR